jgi:hypothetical protein
MAKEVEKRDGTITFKLKGAVRSKKRRVRGVTEAIIQVVVHDRNSQETSETKEYIRYSKPLWLRDLPSSAVCQYIRLE